MLRPLLSNTVSSERIKDVTQSDYYICISVSVYFTQICAFRFTPSGSDMRGCLKSLNCLLLAIPKSHTGSQASVSDHEV